MKRMDEKSKFMISNIWDIINDGIVHLISLSTKHIIITYIIISYHILLYVIFDQSNITLIVLELLEIKVNLHIYSFTIYPLTTISLKF